MSNLSQRPANSPTRVLFASLALVLLLAAPHAVSAQGNANNANSNNSNQNVNGNRNTNTNANANANTNANTNSSTNTNTNANTNVNQNTPTPTPIDAQMRQSELTKTWWYPLLVTMIFAGLLGLFAYAIYRSVRFSKSTFNSPLGLPEGSLRAMLAFLLVVFVGFYVYASVLSFSDFQPPQFLLGIVATVVGFYFGSRTNETRGGGGAAAQPGAVAGTVKDKAGNPAAGATVELTQANGKVLSEQAANDGTYKIDKVPAGDHQIEAKPAPGKPDQPSGKVKVAVEAGETASKDLALK